MSWVKIKCFYELLVYVLAQQLSRNQALPINGKIVLRPPKSQNDEPAQTQARENPRRDNNRERRKDK
jgi:hypothetical protein